MFPWTNVSQHSDGISVDLATC